MRNAKLLALSVERFKSFDETTRVELAPLTIILGRNNSGKSTLIQSLLLLKQTLEARPDVTLRLDGLVEAFNLRELTFGWPDASDKPVAGPTLEVEWESEVDVTAALELARGPDPSNLAEKSGVAWLKNPPSWRLLRTRMTLYTREVSGSAQVYWVHLESLEPDTVAWLDVWFDDKKEAWVCSWNDRMASQLTVELDRFIPILTIDRRQIGPRDRQRAWHNAYLVLFAQPLESLGSLLGSLHYLGSSRLPSPSLFKIATTPPAEIGVSGELAAQLLHRRQNEIVHFLPLPLLSDGGVTIPTEVLAQSLVESVNTTLRALSVNVAVRVEEIRDVGFRLMFGDASLAHVGRGIGYLLPLVELGLFADPLRFKGSKHAVPLGEYQAACASFAHIAIEEPEAHLHPKVASRLAHWLVSLAMANRRLIVETHSDHLVRRLRGLAARAGRGTDLERWLLENVVVLTVDQDDDGRSHVTSTRLTAEGGIAEQWPADFMDEATDEESAIYYAKLDKMELDAPEPASTPVVEMVQGEEPEPDEEP